MKGKPGDPILKDVSRVLQCMDGYPIEAMERLIKKGGAAVPVILDAIGEHSGNEDTDLIPLVVVLGEIGAPEAVSPLVGLLERPKLGEILMDAATDALGKIGKPAIPSLLKLLDSEDPETRFWAVAAMRRMRHPSLAGPLRARLKTMPELAGPIADALAGIGAKDALGEVWEAYRALPENDVWLPEMEGCIACLAGRCELPDAAKECLDWRTAWRRRPQFQWSPAVNENMLCHILWTKRREGTLPDRKLRKKTLEEIFKEQAEAEREMREDEELCEECGRKVLRVVNFPVCPENAYGASLCQESFLRQCLEDGIATLPQALDDLDQELLCDDREWEDLPEEKRGKWSGAQQTYEWLLLDGCRTVRDGIARIRAVREGLGERWGLPQRELVTDEMLEQEALIRSGIGLGGGAKSGKIGRNEPCPCGSGRKYKKCCGRSSEGL